MCAPVTMKCVCTNRIAIDAHPLCKYSRSFPIECDLTRNILVAEFKNFISYRHEFIFVSISEAHKQSGERKKNLQLLLCIASGKLTRTHILTLLCLNVDLMPADDGYFTWKFEAAHSARFGYRITTAIYSINPVLLLEYTYCQVP